jgi:hypothetical protein
VPLLRGSSRCRLFPRIESREPRRPKLSTPSTGNEYGAAGWPRTHEQCLVFRATGSHIRVWGLDDGNGKMIWCVLPPGEDDMAGIVRSFDVCLECSDGTATNVADGRGMSVSWPNIDGVRVDVAPVHLERWVAEGTDPAAALALMAEVVPQSDWLRILRLTHDGASTELDRIAAQGAEEEAQFKQILDDIDEGRWTFSA